MDGLGHDRMDLDAVVSTDSFIYWLTGLETLSECGVSPQGYLIRGDLLISIHRLGKQTPAEHRGCTVAGSGAERKPSDQARPKRNVPIATSCTSGRSTGPSVATASNAAVIKASDYLRKGSSHHATSNAVHGPLDVFLDLVPVRAPLCEFVDLLRAQYAVEAVPIGDDGCQLLRVGRVDEIDLRQLSERPEVGKELIVLQGLDVPEVVVHVAVGTVSRKFL